MPGSSNLNSLSLHLLCVWKNLISSLPLDKYMNTSPSASSLEYFVSFDLDHESWVLASLTSDTSSSNLIKVRGSSSWLSGSKSRLSTTMPNSNSHENIIDLPRSRSNPDESTEGPAKQRIFIDLSAEDDKDESTDPRKRRKIDHENVNGAKPNDALGKSSRLPDGGHSSVTSTSFLGLDRRQMEAERLARSRISPPPSRRMASIESQSPATTSTAASTRWLP